MYSLMKKRVSLLDDNWYLFMKYGGAVKDHVL